MRISDWSSDVCSSDDVEAIAVRPRRHIGAAHVGLGRKAIGDDAAVADARDDRLHLGMVEAKHRGAIEGHIFDELDERALDGVETAIMVQMLRRSETPTSELQSLMRISDADF